MMRNSPFNSAGEFHRSGINIWPLYYQEGENKSILFPLIDIDEHGFAIRPLYHRNNNDYGILWPLCAFNTQDKSGWLGTFFWNDSKNFGLLPLFVQSKYVFWVFPLSWYCSKNDFAVLPLLLRNDDFLWVGNVFKSDDMFLIFPIYGQWKKGFYLLNFIYSANKERQENCYCILPLAYYENDPHRNMLLTPLFSFENDCNELQMLNIGILLYHYSRGKHHVFYPFADVDIQDHYRKIWLWPLFNYGEGRHNDAPFFLFDYELLANTKTEKDGDNYRVRILYPLLFEHKYQKRIGSKTELLPWGSLWYSKIGDGEFDCRVLGGAVFRNSKDAEQHNFSLLYKFFSYHRYRDDVKWEFFPFVKILETSRGNSWSFCWRLLEKHAGGGHIFFIPWGEADPE